MASFESFYKDLKETEQKDSTLTPKQQIERLLRPGSTYRNLNPYEVLQLDPDSPIEEVKKKYRRLSILVHPDKNQDDLERAQAAFDAVKKAYTLLENESTRKCCYEVVEEARGRTKQNMEEKRKKLRKEAQAKGQDPNKVIIEEDNPIKFQHSVSVLTMKLFADLELKRRQNEDKISEDAGKKREQELEREEAKRIEQEFTKNWEESRQSRVNSWNNFRTGKTVSAPAPPPTEKKATPAFQIPTPLTPSSFYNEPPPGAAAPPSYYGGKPGAPQASYYGGKPGAPQASYYGGKPPGAGGYSGYGAASSTSYYAAPVAQAAAAAPPVEKEKKKKEKRFSPMGFRPPKHKPESR